METSKRESGVYRVEVRPGKFDYAVWNTLIGGGLWRRFGSSFTFLDSEFHAIHERVYPEQPLMLPNYENVIRELEAVMNKHPHPYSALTMNKAIEILKSQPSVNVTELVEGLKKINEMSDSGSEINTIIDMKKIARELLTKYEQLTQKI